MIMTNKSFPGEVVGKSRLRTLRIEFDPVKNGETTVTLNNGFRPHGGYRGTNKYPISQYTCSIVYKKELKEDFDHLYASDSLESIDSPGYALNTSKNISHSGESPLFENRLLAPSRLEQQFSPEECAYNIVRNQRKKRPNSGVQYYRPESPHQYLQASGRSSGNNSLTSDSQDCKYGRPTRTTLLRARQQRCNSAPVNMYKMRQEVKKQFEQKQESRKSANAPLTVKDILGASLPQGESLHSFLIGARYNSAHCLDSKSISTHGVYMPRGNPLGCFVMREKPTEGSDGVPATPPDSPASQSDNEEDGPPPSPINKQAWADELPHSTEKRQTAKCTNFYIMDHIMNIDDGLNVKGTKVNDAINGKSSKMMNHHKSRPSSARVPTGGGSRPVSAAKSGEMRCIHSSRVNRGSGPFVLIQGTSYPRSPKSPASYREHYPVTTPPSHRGYSGTGVVVSTPSKRVVRGVGGSNNRKVSTEHRQNQQKSGEAVVEVNVPSVTSVEATEEDTPRENGGVITTEVEKTHVNTQNQDLNQDDGDDEVFEKNHVGENKVQPEVKESVPEPESKTFEEELKPETNSESAKGNEDIVQNDEKLVTEKSGDYQNEAITVQVTKRITKVRFSDQVTELESDLPQQSREQKGQVDNPVLFITEDGANPNTSECEIRENDATENDEGGDVECNYVSAEHQGIIENGDRSYEDGDGYTTNVISQDTTEAPHQHIVGNTNFNNSDDSQTNV